MRPSGESDGAARLAASARERLHFGLADLRIPGGCRLTEWQRTTITFLLERLVGSVESELRASLASVFADLPELPASLASANVALALPILDAASPWQPALIGALLRRAEEHRLQRSAGEHRLLIELAGDSDEALAAEAMSLLIALFCWFV